jgi:hypothetical protein
VPVEHGTDRIDELVLVENEALVEILRKMIKSEGVELS